MISEKSEKKLFFSNQKDSNQNIDLNCNQMPLLNKYSEITFKINSRKLEISFARQSFLYQRTATCPSKSKLFPYLAITQVNIKMIF